jgi:hypothetical protein
MKFLGIDEGLVETGLEPCYHLIHHRSFSSHV